jgi:hypothetical protein
MIINPELPFHEFDLSSYSQIDKMLPGIAVLYVLEAATLVLSIFGVYGARKEKKWAVILVSLPRPVP